MILYMGLVFFIGMISQIFWSGGNEVCREREVIVDFV
jgi:hypothetical protein